MGEWAGLGRMNGKAGVVMIDKLVQGCMFQPDTEHLATRLMACSVGTAGRGVVCRYLIPGEHGPLVLDILERWIHA